MNPADLDTLIAACSHVSSDNKTKFEKLQTVLAQFHQHGTDCILLKGADLIPRLYGVLGTRPMVDVDLLVHEQDLPIIGRLLKGLGYRSQIDGNPAYLDPESILLLDIITRVWYVDDQEVIWARAVQRDFNGIPVKGMGANDLLIYLISYAVIHRGALSPAFALDIALLVAKETLDWEFIVDEAYRRHLKIPLYHGLSYVTKCHHVSIPDQTIRSLAPLSLTEKFHFFLFQKLVIEKPVAGLGFLLLFLTQPGLKKWRWLRDVLFPSPAFLTYRYGERWNTHPLLTRLCRPFSLLSQALRLSLRILGLLLKRPT